MQIKEYTKVLICKALKREYNRAPPNWAADLTGPPIYYIPYIHIHIALYVYVYYI